MSCRAPGRADPWLTQVGRSRGSRSGRPRSRRRCAWQPMSAWASRGSTAWRRRCRRCGCATTSASIRRPDAAAVAEQPGLFFVGQGFQYAKASEAVLGVSRDARCMAQHIARERPELLGPAAVGAGSAL